MRNQVMAVAGAPGADASNMSAVPDPGIRPRRVRLRALPAAVPWARRALRHMLSEWQLERMSDPALLLVSELVTNAVQASDGVCRDHKNRQMITVTLGLTDTSLVIEVWDANSAPPVLQEADITRDCGRGLLLVDFLADAWGHRVAGEGKVVWCEIAIPRTRAAKRRDAGSA